MNTSISTENQLLLAAFIDTFAKVFKVKNPALLTTSYAKIFDKCLIGSVEKFDFSSNGFPLEGWWDLILGDLPLNARWLSTRAYSNKKQLFTTSEICYSASQLTEDGYIISTIDPSTMTSSGKNLLLDGLASSGCSIAGYLETPKNFYQPLTSICPPLVIIKKGPVSKQFLGSLVNEEQAEELAKNFFLGRNGSDLVNGIFTDFGIFKGFDNWKIQSQINALQSEYKNYKTITFSNLLKELVPGKRGIKFEDKLNTIYIHKVGTKPVVSSLDRLDGKQDYFIQCSLDENLVSSFFLESFFSTELGKLILSSISSGVVVPHISLMDLRNAEIPLPSLKDQNDINDSIKKLKRVRSLILEFENNVSINPLGALDDIKRIDLILDIAGQLSKADKLASVIRGGETKTVEFKQTFNTDIKTWQRFESLEITTLKTIVGFLNAKGGQLFIGVHDSGEITGINEEMRRRHKNSVDDYLKHVKDIVKTSIGIDVFDYIEYEVVSINGKQILHFECKQSPKPFFLKIKDKKSFFIRTNPATEELDGPELIEYISNHFKNN